MVESSVESSVVSVCRSLTVLRKYDFEILINHIIITIILYNYMCELALCSGTVLNAVESILRLDHTVNGRNVLGPLLHQVCGCPRAVMLQPVGAKEMVAGPTPPPLLQRQP